jgi:cyclic-di-AMP phosphodiesterase PgpH
VRPLLGMWLLFAVVAASAFVLTPTRLTPAFPGDEALGSVSAVTIKADRDYDVLDAEATQARRDEAARSVRPVYHFDASAAVLLQARIEAAFAQGRAAVDEWQRQNPAKAARVSAAQAERVRAAGPLRHKAQPEEAELLRYLASHKDEFLKALQAVIDDDDYLELAKTGFDPTVERAALRLAGVGSTGYAVEERELLAAERERGITVRPIRGDSHVGAGPETLVRDIDRIRDLAQVRAEVDKLAADQLSDLPLGPRKAVGDLVRRSIRPNLTYQDAETRGRIEAKRLAVREVFLAVRKGEKILGDGEVITRQHLVLFRAIRDAGRGPGAEQVRWGSALLTAVICAALFEFGRRNLRKFRLRSRDVILLAGVLLLQLLLLRGGLALADHLHDRIRDTFGPRGWQEQLAGDFLLGLLPLAAGAMLVRFLTFSEASLIWIAAAALLQGFLTGPMGLQTAVLALVAGVVAADRVGHAGSRAAVFRAGLWTAGASVALLSALALFGGRFFTGETAAQLLGAALSGALLTPLLVLLVAPLGELIFGAVTDVRLLELASFNHPVLKDLIVQAPGTYHHSIVLGQLVEAASRKIGANALLARVGAYYRDIGKGKNPLYFGENQRTDNRHDQLTPQTSAEIIVRHVQDGIDLAVQAHLPAAVIDFIPQHHGTRVVGYFFAKAKEDAARLGLPPPAEEPFRYPGPKPQSREAALVMMGEVVVATASQLGDAPPAELERQVQQIVERAVSGVLAEGQLDECDFTSRDLALTQEAFVETVLALTRARAEGPPAGSRPPPLRVLQTEGAERKAGAQ